MSKDVFVVAQGLVTPLGNSINENFNAIVAGKSSIRNVMNSKFSDQRIALSSFEIAEGSTLQTSFETICISAIQQLFANIERPTEQVLFILSTTKGNIELLEKNDNDPNLNLERIAKSIARHFGFEKHLVVSTACTSGLAAIIAAKRYLATGKFAHAIVVGAEVLSKFVFSGFQSLMALSDLPCKPFDKNRNGINLGEAAAALYLTTQESFCSQLKVRIAGCGMTSDANHISGPSRTGDELAHAIQIAMDEANCSAVDIDFISAHGTATLYNDEMEAKAFHSKQLYAIPTHSLKGYYGHTLGAAGVLESVICIQALIENWLIASLGYVENGMTNPLNIIETGMSKSLNVCLKTASGFGGANAAIVFIKTA